MITLPNELIHYIISFVHDQKTLLKCSFVSHYFLTATRSQIFAHLRLWPPGGLRSRLYSADTFLSLCESPLCTIPLERVHKLEMYGNVLERVSKWVAQDGRTLNDIMGETLKELQIQWLWIDTATKRNLYDCFCGVTMLELKGVEFVDAEDLGKIVNSFPMLQKLVLLGVSLRTDSEEVGSHDVSRICRGPPKDLRTIKIRSVEAREMLAQLVPYGRTLRHFDCMLDGLYDDTFTVILPEIGGLLREARSLTSFMLTVCDNLTRSFDIIAAHIDFSCNPLLRELGLEIEGSFPVIPFLEHISSSHNIPCYSSSPTPTLESLVLTDFESILERPTDWSLFDTILQTPYFSSLREITWTHKEYCFSPEELQVSSSTAPIHSLADDSLVITLNGDRASGGFPCQGTLAYASIAERLEKYRENLPGCNKRGLLKLHLEYFR